MTNTSRFTLLCILHLPSNYVLFTHSNTEIHKIKKIREFISFYKEGKEPRHLGRSPQEQGAL